MEAACQYADWKIMRIALYMTTVLNHSGGLEKYLIETASTLSSQYNIEVDIISMDNKHTNFINLLLSFFFMHRIKKEYIYQESDESIANRLKDSKYYKITSFRELRKTLNNYDVVYSKNELLEAVILKFAVKFHRIPPVIFGCHTPLLYPTAKSMQSKLHNFLYGSRIYKRLVDSVFAFHVLNNYENEVYSNKFKQSVYKIYNPFNVLAYRKTASLAMSKRDKSNQVTVVWAGRLSEQKGAKELPFIINSVNMRIGNSAKVNWIICGDGEYKDYLKNEIKANNIDIRGHVNNNFMSNVYSSSNIFFSTSHWEGYPYNLIEPQAFGLTILGYNIPGVSDVLNGYDGGIIADNDADLINKLTFQVEKYSTTAGIFYEYSHQYDPKTIYPQLIKMFEYGAQK